MGALTPLDFRTALARVGYSQRAFARLVGANERTVRRWTAGTLDVPTWVPVLLGLMEQRSERSE